LGRRLATISGFIGRAFRKQDTWRMHPHTSRHLLP
jgi:hypothetical protein